MSKEINHLPPKAAYYEMLKNPELAGPGLRSATQLKSKKYREDKQEKGSLNNRANFAHHIQHLQKNIHTHPFLQSSNCAGPTDMTTVLGFDKTFNLGDLHVTIGAFKHLAVVRQATARRPPDFPRPCTSTW